MPSFEAFDVDCVHRSHATPHAPRESGSDKVKLSSEMSGFSGFKGGCGGFGVLDHACLPVLSGNRSGARRPIDR